jgi:Grx4 family monothiol glutaredoxin
LTESQVILFIKGTAENPKCGFTETLLKLFQDQDISFTYYDILADEYMRYWLRNYSGWPTYPQVHSNGKLIGGLDVCKELVAKGELIGRVPKNSRAAVADRLKELLGEYKHIVLTQDFSYKDLLAQDFISKVKAQYPNE